MTIVLKSGFEYWNSRLYYLSVALLLASVPLSKYTTSLSQFLMLGFWLLHGSDLSCCAKYQQSSKSGLFDIISLTGCFFRSITISLFGKFKQFATNRVALIITSLLLLHVVGLAYTSDFDYAFKDLRTKLPLLLLPLFFSTGPEIDKRTMYSIFLVYVLAIFGGTLYRLILFIQLPVADARAMNPHISHIRFSLNAVFSVFILFYMSRLKETFSWKVRGLFILTAIWFIVFMIYLKYSTGLSILFIISVLLILYYSLKGRRIYTRLLLFAGGLVLIAIPVSYFLSITREFRSTEAVDFRKLETRTINGNYYYHDTVNFKIENGAYTGLYICDKELRKSWSDRSQFSIDSLDRKQQPIRFTLIRYLASKQLRKDSAGVANLDQQDILNIESGLTSSRAQQWYQLRPRIENLLVGWENYRHHNNPNSSSLIQRVEYWRCSLLIIADNPIIGVGTGDVPTAFASFYDKNQSRLDPQFRLRSHNQFLSITVAFGIAGLLWFLFVLIAPMIKAKGYRQYLYVIFWMIFFISIFTEDTLETQEGVTFFAFFTAFFLLGTSESRHLADREEK